MDNNEKVANLAKLRLEATNGGGEAKVKAQHNAGKKTARERIALLFDEGTFIETDSFLKNRNPLTAEDSYADGVVAGYGTVNGSLVYAYCQDFTVLSGSVGEMNAKKIAKIYNMAIKTGAPLVSVIDCGGIRLEDGLDGVSAVAEIMASASEASGVIPQICMVAGPCAGSMTFIPAVSDFVFAVDKISKLYVNSKEVIEGTTEEKCDSFATSVFAAKNGMADFVCATEEECFAAIKNLLLYLPSNYQESTFTQATTDDINRACDITSLIPEDDKASFNMLSIISEIADNKAYVEIAKDYAKNMITALIQLNSETVGVVANQPMEGDSLLDEAAAKKAAKFVQFCDSFGIPVLSLVDCEGYAISFASEKAGLMKEIAKLGFAFHEATVAKVNVIVRKAYGGAFAVMNSKQMGADFSYALPTAIISATTPEIALNMFYTDEVKKASNPVSARQEIMDNYKNEAASPYEAAKRGYIDDIIDPSALRPVLVSAFDVLSSKRITKTEKKHGNLPM
ncbi:acyl-CoA carboxylase subunit beta [Acetivibrio sp. MSJd-27]|uniref:acyl-CoA carboxylase subunit beta n=1 Tax=Acetivibrio sp. MSJd-27 TaxID=2841523 RepID=UPI001C10D9CC|nr:carboxyl transferase domain-containing protein [Acetivibrio sp. MSJd-27]MBU5451170.1 methylmalonyl-CoA carboxyltransferase [Acetivibrio sp. MSJd-27]